MISGIRTKDILSKAAALLLSIAMILTMMPVLAAPVYAEGEAALELQTPALLVTGKGLIGNDGVYDSTNVSKEKSYTLEELKNLGEGAVVYGQKYSAMKNSPFTKNYYLVDGVRVDSLLGKTESEITDDVIVNSVDNYPVSFLQEGEYKNGKTKTVGINQPRYFYTFTSAGTEGNYDKPQGERGEQVPAVIGWAEISTGLDGGANYPTALPEGDPQDLGFLKLYLGQLGEESGGEGDNASGIWDRNQALFCGKGVSSQVNSVQEGEAIGETVLTARNTSYTRADLLMMDFAERSYTYTTSKGEKTDLARGIPLSTFFEGKSDDAVVSFHTADNYGVGDAEGMTVKELTDGNYMLAYEVNGAGVYSANKSDATQYGFLTLYGDGYKPAKMVDGIMVADPDSIDFDSSPYKHVTNGGISGQEGPYNIDSITSATITVEGPGMKTSVPLSVKDMESRSAGYVRDKYTDVRNGESTTRTYEGMDLYYLLHNMSSGSQGIKLTDNAYQVTIKNRNRRAISTFTLEEIEKAHNDGRPILMAYGTALEDGSSPAPFVFDGATGTISGLGNDDGCVKLVYDTSEYGDNADYTKFGNMAYVYVEEASRPGFKHTVPDSQYNTSKNTQTIISVTGDKLGREVNYTIEDIENMVQYDDNGDVIDNGLGYRDSYSLTNTTYWYINEYEGVRLWNLLLKSGLDPSLSTDDETKVNYLTTDNYAGTDKFTLKEIADDNTFGFYEKNALDYNDGKYTPNENIRVGDDPTTGDKLAEGYPVLLAYGINGYPYAINNTDPGFLSGLSNDGGPVRVISGKKEYGHNNGSSQAQRLSGIVVGTNNYHYASHKYHEDPVYTSLKDETLTVNITTDGDTKTKSFTVGDIEDIIYDGTLTSTQLGSAKVKAKYKTAKGSDLFEGVNLAYFLQNTVALSGIEGTVTFTNSEGDTLSVPLADILNMNNGYNADTGVDNLVPVLAYGKNGYPMVNGKNTEDGYVSSVALAEGTDLEQTITVKNQGGPLQVLIPAPKDGGTLQNLTGVVSIDIDLQPDNYSHSKAPYNTYADQEITVSGDGTNLTEPKVFTVAELEEKQNLAGTYDYSMLNKKGTTSTARFRGIRLYDLLRSPAIGLKSNADQVVVTSRDGASRTFSINDIIKTDYINSQDSSVTALPVLLAFGSADVSNEDPKDGKPLVTDEESEGYDAAYANKGGPVKFVIGQKDAEDVNNSNILSDVASIEITAAEIVNWNHSSSATFASYLDKVVTFEAIDKDNNVFFTKEVTVKELEEMSSLISQTNIPVSNSEEVWEGLNLWGTISTVMKRVKGLSDPVSIKCIAPDGYSYNVMERGLDALQNGIKDGETYYPIILAYGRNGTPLAQKSKNEPEGPGYDSNLGNDNGPIRLVILNGGGNNVGDVVKVQVKVTDTTLDPEETPDPQTEVKFDTFPGSSAQGSLPLAGIRSTAMDKDGNLWVGTYGGGAAYKAKGSESFTVYNLASEPALTTAVVSAICPDDNGGVYMSQNASYSNPSGNSGMAYMKDGEVTYYRAPDTVPNDYVQEIKIDDKGIVWIGSFGGLTKYDPKAGTWQTWDKGDGFPAESIDNIEFDGKGGIWCGFYPDSSSGDGSSAFEGGFAYFKDGKVVKSYTYTSPQDANTGAYRLGDVWVRDIAVDKNGGAWVVASGSYKDMANTGGRVYYVSEPGADAQVFTGFDLFGEDAFTKDSELRMVTVDPDGGLWFGTSADGVFHVADPAIKDGKLTLTEQFSSADGSWEDALFDNVYSLDFHGNTLYSGTSGGLATHEFTFENGGEEPEAPTAGDATAETAQISFTGNALSREGYFSIKGIKNTEGIDKVSATFKWLNNAGTTGTSTVEGATLENIFNYIGMPDDMVIDSVRIIASDGYADIYTAEQALGTSLDGNKAMFIWNDADKGKVQQVVRGQFAADDANKGQWITDASKVVVTGHVEINPAVSDVTEAIDSIPEAEKVTTENADDIIAAREAYEALSDEEKAKVGDITKLEEAEAALTEACKTEGEAAIESIDYADYSASNSTALWINVSRLESKLEKVTDPKEAAEIYKKIEEAVNGTKTLKEETLENLNEFPVTVTAKSTGYNKITVKWSRIPAAGSYTVYRGESPDGEFKEIKSTPNESYTDTGLKTGKKYYYVVAAKSRVRGEYVYGNPSDQAVASPKLGKTTVKVKAGKKKATITWKKVSGASGYEIYRSTKKSKGFKKVKTVAKGSTVKLVNKKLKAKKTYYYKIRAYRTVSGKKVYGAYSSVKSVKIKKK